MWISIAQICTDGDQEANLHLVLEHITRAAEQGAEVVVFPEATTQGFGTGRLDTGAETTDGPFTQRVLAAARRHNIAVVWGGFLPADTVSRGEKTIHRVANTAFVARPGEQEEVLTYEKLHTFDAFGFAESDTVRPGQHLLVFSWRGVSFGVAICYDLRFPGMFRELSRRGAQVIVVPTSWANGPGKLEQYRLVAMARAIDTGAFVVTADQAVPAQERSSTAPTGVGHSLVVGPDGVVLAEASSAPELITVEINPAVADERKKQVPVLEYGDDYSDQGSKSHT